MASIDIPGYDIYEQLGRGGMATVYRARHINLDREVALKVIDTDHIADPSFSERFVREARISARLSHPHILQIYDVNVHGSLDYISMELLHGGDLEEIIRGAMTQRTIYQVMQQMTAALDYAAGQGYVHRDIKPSNIMMRGLEDFVLADFGIAKAADSSTQMTQAGLLVGTPSYMSPEQAEGAVLDGRSDLYSLAVVCYEMLTKQVPYEADSAVSTAVKHLTEKVPRLPKELAVYQPFLDRGLAKRPEDRFQNGREMYQAFAEVREHFRDDEVLTPPAPTPDRPTPPLGTVLESGHTALWADTGSHERAGSGDSYRLHPTSGGDEVLSGIRNERRVTTPRRRRTGAGGTALAALALLLLAGGAGAYYYWQHTGPGSTAGATNNEQAIEALLQRASEALAGGDFDGTRELLEQARVANPGAPGIRRLESELAAADTLRQQAANEKVQQATAKNLQLLLAAGSEMAASGDHAGAGDKFSTALELSPDSEAAREGLAQAVESLATAATEAARTGSFDQADGALAQALALAPDREDLAQQRASLPALRAQWAFAQKIEEGRRLLAQEAFTAAAALFRGALEQDPASTEAQQGLKACADGMLAAARADAQRHRYDSAREKLTAALAWQPDHTDAAALQAELPARERAWKDEQAAIARRKADANRRANSTIQAITAGDLGAARRGYAGLSGEYPDLDVTRDVRQRLLAAYTAAVKKEIEVQSYETAQALIDEGQVLAPELAVWAELREEVEVLEANDHRRLGAY